MANLFPTGYEDEVVLLTDVEADKAVGYRSGVAFDYQLEDFPRDGMHKLMDSTGIESWKAWCVNCLRTERGKHLAYNTDFGIDMDSALKAGSREEAESILTREITEALMADPYERTAYISDITFTWESLDTVAVSVTIHGIDDVTIDISTYLAR
jgi:hypothetical protein